MNSDMPALPEYGWSEIWIGEIVLAGNRLDGHYGTISLNLEDE